MKNNDVVRYAYKKGYRIDAMGNIVSPYGRILKTTSMPWGHLRTTIRIDGKCYPLMLHRLCAYQKYGEKVFEAECVRHLDGNPKNNKIENIAIGTFSDNMMDIPKKIRKEKSLLAIRCRKDIYTDAKVSQIRDFYNANKSYKKTQKQFGISSKGTLYYILNKRTSLSV